MPEQHEIYHAIVLLKLSRYLITRADEKGMTHGEKHFFLQTCLQLLHEAQDKLGDDSSWIFDRHEVKNLDPSDIPF